MTRLLTSVTFILVGCFSSNNCCLLYFVRRLIKSSNTWKYPCSLCKETVFLKCSCFWVFLGQVVHPRWCPGALRSALTLPLGMNLVQQLGLLPLLFLLCSHWLFFWLLVKSGCGFDESTAALYLRWWKLIFVVWPSDALSSSHLSLWVLRILRLCWHLRHRFSQARTRSHLWD